MIKLFFACRVDFFDFISQICHGEFGLSFFLFYNLKLHTFFDFPKFYSALF
jgi:hypothetical protein